MYFFIFVSNIYILYFGIYKYFKFMHLYLHLDPKKRYQVFLTDSNEIKKN